MTLAADPDLVMFAFTAEIGSKSEEALDMLATWTATPGRQLAAKSGEINLNARQLKLPRRLRVGRGRLAPG